jgi:Ca2+-binding RTX toxin-like protein
MTTPTPFEQLTVELINQARLNPHGEYDRWVTNAPANVLNALNFFQVDLNVLKQQFDALVPSAPLAWNEALGTAALGHTQAMKDADLQSHQVPGEPSLGTRVNNAGYAFSTVGENIFAFAQDAYHAHAAFFIDWGTSPTGIQQPPGHRNNIMNPAFTEVGVGHLTDNDPGTNVGPNLVTHNLGNRHTYTAQITGVIFDDANGNRFYDIGEGLGSVSVSTTAGNTTSYSSGGYNLAVAAGTHTLTFGGPLGPASITVALGTQNIKVDMYDPGSFRSSVTATLGANAIAVELLGEAAINATGNALNNFLIGNGAANVLMGGAGVDTLIGGAGNDTLDGGSVPNPANQGNFLFGGDGDDTYIVRNTFDLVHEHNYLPEFAQFGGGGFDTIHSKANWFWDIYGIGERLIIDADAHDPGGLGTTIVGGVWNNEIVGNAGTNVMFGRGGSDTYRPDDGIDYISFSLLGVPANLYEGVRGNNTVILEARKSGPTSYAIVFEFDPAKDKFNVADYGYGSKADMFARGVNDGAGNSYFILGDGLDYAYVIGKELSALNADIFIV